MESSSEDEDALDTPQRAQLQKLHQRIEEARGRWQLTLQVLRRDGSYECLAPVLLASTSNAESDDDEAGESNQRREPAADEPAKALHTAGRASDCDFPVNPVFKATSRKHCTFRVRKSHVNPGIEILEGAPRPFSVGQSVQHRSKDGWVDAKIRSINDDGTIYIDRDGGERDTAPPALLRRTDGETEWTTPCVLSSLRGNVKTAI